MGVALDETSVQRGKAARAASPRSSHAEWAQPPQRQDPVAVLAAQDVTRIPQLVPLRYGRMLVSPFTFFRGAAAIMAADLATTPISGLRAQLCGDAHLSNFGGFAAPDRSLVFDLNDFDETLPGPWEWDLKRLAASLAVAGRDRGFSTSAREDVVRGGVRAYRRAMREFAGMRTLDVWYARLEVESLFARWGKRLDSAGRRTVDKTIAKAHGKDSLRAFAKLTHTVDGRPRIVSQPPLIIPVEELAPEREAHDIDEFLRTLVAQYAGTLPDDRRVLIDGYRPVHFAHKVVGVGSVGNQAWIVLAMGHDDGDPLFLQVKEASASVLEPFAGKSAYTHPGRRVVEGQRLMQAASDILLGWLTVQDDKTGVPRNYYVRQLWDAKASAQLDAVPASDLEAYAEICGWTLARAHARSGDRCAIAAYIGSSDRLDRALVRFAEAYADQNERDYEALVAAAKSGRVIADGFES
ncbi:DUF2252 domain-containing protein [Solirubrobacter ginsenosidimutans]|uniref:DUF2252 domain-containing protein n=1 Tax=Solirubrobacter ginsenosidimutans TaxID=490573 RepID=A0A9X3MXE3_9ACTN|nr:DUF2252 domain-containing protein [Solirubrobacter ginsenosidimutans]MDA0164479.1 DUF2252 domain-containing protein [Solirubrobacter ginsenosidimutans]